jgi:class 3 adenylate cyclase
MGSEQSGPRFFLSYRREDSAGHAGRLADHLLGRFGSGSVFMDVESIQGGVDFAGEIARAIGGSDAVLVIIGPGWIDARGPGGARRLEDPADFVLSEVAAALDSQVRVIPVLVSGASMPTEDELPGPIADLGRLNAVEIQDRRWREDVEALEDLLERRVSVCPRCGRENPQDAAFCMGCGSALQAAAPARELRKTVTVVVAGMMGSTALGDELDPEALRGVMFPYFDAMREALERHGGTVEKVIGDAVIAIFGIPTTHEDDAMRAVRAALDMRPVLAQLNEGFGRDQMVELSARIGVNTGEVIAGDTSEHERLIGGETVNVAVRLEQAAAAGEILLGRDTYRLVREAVQVEDFGPLELKGKSEPVPAFRLRSLQEDDRGLARHTDTSFVGREREIGLITDAYRFVVGERSSTLFTLLGTAGVGKSRLVAEVLAALDPEPLVLTGRCLPYGEGITFWPVLEFVKTSAGVAEDDPPEAVTEKIRGVLGAIQDAEQIATRLLSLLGLAPQSGALDETFWAIRRYIETLAVGNPVAVVFDDIHWAEPALLDLIEHIADWSRDAPILLLCVARPEFLDERPGWGGGKMNATSILLESLDERHVSALVENLLGRSDFDQSLAVQIVRVSEGNPLFVEELLSALAEDGFLERRPDGTWVQARAVPDVELPTSIQILLASRLERLEPAELVLIEGGAVVGQVFYRGAVAALAPEYLRPDVGTYLKSLVRKDLLRPELGGFPGDESYRFRHLLIRDAAYRAMRKETRADLHERFADWLERMAGERIAEYEEILGYHLEQAYHYRSELGQIRDQDREVARRASERLSAAGRRAIQRGDARAAANLFSRAAALLLGDDPRWLELSLEHGISLARLGDLVPAKELLGRVAQVARERNDLRTETRALVEGSFVDSQLADFAGIDEIAETAISSFEKLGDQLGLASAWRLRGWMAWNLAGAGETDKAMTRALEHAIRADDHREKAEILQILALVTTWGPTAADAGLKRCDELLQQSEGDRSVEGSVMATRATLSGMLGNFDGARTFVQQALEILTELGRGLYVGMTQAQECGLIERWAGDIQAAERMHRKGIELLEQVGERSFLSTALAMLAETVYLQERYEEAEDLSHRSEDLGDPDDVATQAYWRSVRAKVLARKGDVEAAEELGREAVQIVDRSDFCIRGDIYADLAETLRLLGRPSDAISAARGALRVYEEKRNIVSIRKMEEAILELEPEIG